MDVDVIGSSDTGMDGSSEEIWSQPSSCTGSTSSDVDAQSNSDSLDSTVDTSDYNDADPEDCGGEELLGDEIAKLHRLGDLLDNPAMYARYANMQLHTHAMTCRIHSPASA